MKANSWTSKEDKTLKKYFSSDSFDDLLIKLPRRTKTAIIVRAYKLGLRRNVESHEWPNEELEILKNNYEKKGMFGVAKMLPNHSLSSIYLKAKALGLVYIYGDKRWTKDEDEIVKQFYPTEGTYICFRLNNRSRVSIKSRAKTLGIKFDRITEPWSIEEERVVVAFYLNRIYSWYEESSLDELIKELNSKGFVNHSKNSIKMKLANCSFLHTGYGLENASLQNQNVYEELMGHKSIYIKRKSN